MGAENWRPGLGGGAKKSYFNPNTTDIRWA